MRRVCGWLAVVGLLVGAPAAGAFKYVEEGQKAPDFTAKGLGGEPLRLADRIGPKALVVVFWATWSPRSRPALDDLEALLKERGDKGLAVLAVNVEHEVVSPEERQVIASWAAHWSFPVGIDEGLSAFSSYGVVATPSLAVLDPQGVVRYARAGYSSSAREDVREAVDGLLGLAQERAARLGIKVRDYVPPKMATLHYQKALVLVQRGMARKAFRDLEEAAALDPAWPEPKVELARLLRAEGSRRPDSRERAERLLREARAARPKHVQTLTALAEVLLDQGKNDEALGTADEALSVQAEFTPALVAKSRALRALGRPAEAEKIIEEALLLDPRSPANLAERADVAAAQGDWRQAAASLRAAVERALEKHGGVE